MGNISVSRTGNGGLSALPPSNTIIPGGNPALWQNVYSVTASVKNTGHVSGAAVPQLYLGLPGPSHSDPTPVKVLRGFKKIMLRPGQSKTVTFDLTRRDISSWDVVAQQWAIASGSVKVFAGFSSRDIKATTAFEPLGGASGY